MSFVKAAITTFQLALQSLASQRLLILSISPSFWYNLHKYGIEGNLHKWLSIFLTKRHMNCDCRQLLRIHVTVDSGILQGVVLDTLLFLSHINDLPAAALKLPGVALC